MKRAESRKTQTDGLEMNLRVLGPDDLNRLRLNHLLQSTVEIGTGAETSDE